MSPRRDLPRQNSLSTDDAEALRGARAGRGGIVATLVDEQLREEQDQEQRRRVRPAELRRRRKQACITFSVPDMVDRLRALAERWDWRAGNGGPNVSKVVETLLLPRLEAAERGEIDPASLETVAEREKTEPQPIFSRVEGQWF